MADETLSIIFDAASLSAIGNMKLFKNFLQPGIAASVQRTADAIVTQAQKNTETVFENPTGELSANISDEMIGVYEAQIIVDVPYAWRMEEGFNGTDSIGRTYSEEGKPYLSPAVESVKSGVVGLFASSILSAIGSAFGG